MKLCVDTTAVAESRPVMAIEHEVSEVTGQSLACDRCGLRLIDVELGKALGAFGFKMVLQPGPVWLLPGGSLTRVRPPTSFAPRCVPMGMLASAAEWRLEWLGTRRKAIFLSSHLREEA